MNGGPGRWWASGEASVSTKCKLASVGDWRRRHRRPARPFLSVATPPLHLQPTLLPSIDLNDLTSCCKPPQYQPISPFLTNFNHYRQLYRQQPIASTFHFNFTNITNFYQFRINIKDKFDLILTQFDQRLIWSAVNQMMILIFVNGNSFDCILFHR